MLNRCVRLASEESDLTHTLYPPTRYEVRVRKALKAVNRKSKGVLGVRRAGCSVPGVCLVNSKASEFTTEGVRSERDGR